MPCNSDYLEPTSREIELRRAARLLVWVREQTGTVPEEWAMRAAKHPYGNGGDRAVTALCDTLKGIEAADRERIVYNSKDPVSRDLADWWEAHQAADRAREERDRATAKQRGAYESGIAKLTPEERAALGLPPDADESEGESA